MMKKSKIIFALLILMFICSCADNLDKINTDPNGITKDLFDANLLLPTATHLYGRNLVGYSGPILFQSMWVQTFSCLSAEANYYSNGDKYVSSGNTNEYISNLWTRLYESASKAYEMEFLAKESGNTNLANIGKILQILAIGTLSDIYGSVPYSEALQAKYNNINLPKYDKQEELYPKMLEDLDAAILVLDTGKSKPTRDILYNGDVSKWKKFGYSIMLRMAMRLVKVDNALAKQYAEKAFTGGVFTEVDDGAILPTDNGNGYGNPNASALNTAPDFNEVRWSKTIIDYLQASNDPRLSVIAEVPEAGLKNLKNAEKVGDNTPAIQIGLPNGYNETTIVNHPDYPGASGTGDDAAIFGKYSRPTAIYRNLDAPVFILSYSQIELLLAEAKIRGYNVSGDASTHYLNGITAAMTEMEKFGDAAKIDATSIETYTDANPLDISSEDASLEMINTQYWLNSGILSNYLEAWNNWKRTNYPNLTPVNYPFNFSSGQIPRRQPYPLSESTQNTENKKEAVENMGGEDDWITRVWWDK